MPLPLCVRTDANAKRSRNALLADGWREIEILETWRLEKETVPCIGYEVEEARDSDRNECVSIAALGFKNSRFHKDKSIREPDAIKVRQLMDAWDGDKGILVCRQSGKCIGFLIWCHDVDLVIDLIAVSAKHQRKGAARAMISALRSKGFPVRAGTQSDNPGRALYESMGFEIVKRERTFHK